MLARHHRYFKDYLSENEWRGWVGRRNFIHSIP